MEKEKISIEPEKIDTADVQPPEEQKEKKGKKRGKYKKIDTAEEQPPEEQKKKGKKRITDEHREKLKLNIKRAQEARGKYKKNEKIITNDILDLMLLFSS